MKMKRELIIWMCILFSGVVDGFSNDSATNVQFHTIYTISVIKFPPSARMLFFSHQKGMDDQWKAKIQMSIPEFKIMLDEVPLRNINWSSKGTFIRGDELLWSPEKLEHPSFGQARLEKGRIANFIYSYIDGEYVIFYIQIFET